MPKHSARVLKQVLTAAAFMVCLVSAAAGEPQSRYRVQNGDTLELNFTFVPEFNQTITVQPDGFVTLRAAGDLKAAGLTIPELQKAIESRYIGVLNDPVVAVELKDFEKPYFLAQGEVQKPGKYELRSDLTLSQAVAVAGGLSSDAKHSQVLVFRRVSGSQFDVREIDLKRVLSGSDLSDDVQIQPGDMVFVPKNRISKIKPFVPLPYLRFMIPGL